MILLRFWIRHGPPEEHRLTLAAGVVVLALIGWALVPTGRHARTGRFAGLTGQPTLQPAPGADGHPGSVTPDVGAPLGGRDAGDAAGPGGAGPRTARQQQGLVPGVGGPEVLAQRRAGCPPLTASDQGVTPTEVHIGVADLDVADPNVSQQFGVRTDTKEVVDAYVADINDRGGIACRKLVVQLYKINPFDVQDQQAVCTKAAHDDRMFAFLDLGFLTTLTTQKCVTLDNHVPLVEDTDWPARWVQAQTPFYVSPNTDANRSARNWVFLAKRAGFFDPSRGFKKLGLLDCRDDDGIADEIKRDLATVGVTSIKESTLSCQDNLVAPPSEITQAVLDQKLDGVTNVFPATLSTNVEVFLQAADSQDFHPRYGASDLYELTAPGLTESFDAAQWNGTLAYTSSRSGELRNGTAAPETVRCDAVLRAHGVPGIKTEWDDFARAYCDVLHLFTVGMNRAGATPTRLSFSQAVQTAGRLGFSGVSDGLFDHAGAFTGADFVRTIQWRADTSTCSHGDPRGRSQQSTGCWFVLDPAFQPSH